LLLRKFVIPIIIGILLVFPTGNSFADPIPSLFSSGVDATGNPLPLTSPDPHYDVVENANQAAIVMFPHPAYFPNDANSQWIWETSSGFPINVFRTITTTFDLTGFDHTTTQINMLAGADNQIADIRLNGVSTGLNQPCCPGTNFSVLTPFSINSGFQPGINTLEFIVADFGVISGFRVEITSATADPEELEEPVVGGELLQIDSMALMLAGLQSSAIWMLPILAGAIGVGVFFFRRK
jgi:hypothetical protein